MCRFQRARVLPSISYLFLGKPDPKFWLIHGGKGPQCSAISSGLFFPLVSSHVRPGPTCSGCCSGTVTRRLWKGSWSDLQWERVPGDRSLPCQTFACILPAPHLSSLMVVPTTNSYLDLEPQVGKELIITRFGKMLPSREDSAQHHVACAALHREQQAAEL